MTRKDAEWLADRLHMQAMAQYEDWKRSIELRGSPPSALELLQNGSNVDPPTRPDPQKLIDDDRAWKLGYL